jgi:hypothetical protein
MDNAGWIRMQRGGSSWLARYYLPPDWMQDNRCRITDAAAYHLPSTIRHLDTIYHLTGCSTLQKWAKCYLLIWQFCTLWKIAFFGVFKENFFLFTFFNAQEKRSKNPVYFLLFKNQQQRNKKGTSTRKARRKPSRKALKSFILLYIVFIIIYLLISRFLRFVTFWFSNGLICF